MKNFKIGEMVWFESLGNAIPGVVLELPCKDLGMFVKLRSPSLGICYKSIEDCYKTEAELRQAMQIKKKERVQNYCESIKTVEDLVRFCYDNAMLAEEYTNWEARKAARIRAKELLGIELKE